MHSGWQCAQVHQAHCWFSYCRPNLSPLASYQGQPDVSELSMQAEVLPCMEPFALRFFLDAELSKPVPCDETDPAQFVLQHTAGDTVKIS